VEELSMAHPKRLWTIAAVCLLAGCSAKPAEEAAKAGYRVFVTNERGGSLSVIDGATQRVTDTIALGKRPRGIALSPDGTRLYIALSGSPIGGPGVDESKLPPPDKTADGIAIFDVASLKLERVLRSISDPEQLAVSPDGRRLYVASEDSGKLIVLDAKSGAVVGSVDVGGEPEGVAVSPSGDLVAVTSEAGNHVALVDMSMMKVRATVPVGERPRGLSFARDGKTLFSTSELGHVVSLIDPAAGRVTGTIPLDQDLRAMALVASDDGKTLFVSTGRGGRIIRIDIAGLKQDGAATVGARPWGLGASPDGATLYSANGSSDDVSVVDAKGLRETMKIKAGEGPWGIAVVPR
jgi:YVTN family beta-propeller protein